MHFADTGEILELDGMVRAVLNTAIPSYKYLQKQREKSIKNGIKGGRPKAGQKPKQNPCHNPDINPNVNLNVNPNVNLNERHQVSGISKSVNQNISKSINHISCPSAEKTADGREGEKTPLKENTVEILEYLNFKPELNLNDSMLKNITAHLRDHPPNA